MPGSEPAPSTLLVDLVASGLSSQGDELTFELLRLSDDPLLLSAFIKRAKPIGTTSCASIQPAGTIPFLAIKPAVRTGKGSDRFNVEPLHPRSVRPEAFVPPENEERLEFCGHGAFGVEGGFARILVIVMVTAGCLLVPWLWPM